MMDELEIQRAYDVAENILDSFVTRDEVLVRDERKRAETIRTVARAIADGVIRNNGRGWDEDISSLGEVHIEWANAPDEKEDDESARTVG